MKYKLLLIFGLIGAMGQAQENVDSLWKALVPQKSRPYIIATGSIGAQSNHTTTRDVLQVLGNDFLDNSEKENLVPSAGRLRLGYMRKMEIGYRQPAYKIFDTYSPGQGFSIANTYYSSAGMSNDMARLILFGNKHAAGETLDLDNSRFESWYYTNLKYHFDVIIDSTLPVRFTAGIVMGHDHSSYALHTAQLYTAPDGEFLDVNLDYRYRESIGSSVLNGMGLALGFQVDIKTGKKSVLNIELDDLGLVAYTNSRSLDTDSSYRFRGVQFSNIFEINDSLLARVDADYQRTYNYEKQGSMLRLLPFRISAAHRWLTGNRSFPQIFASAGYLHLPGYYPKISVGTLYKPATHHQLQFSLSGGGFYIAGVDMAYQWDIARYWQLRLEVINFSGLVVPTLPGGAIVSGSLRYEF